MNIYFTIMSSGKGSKDVITKLTQNMVTSLTDKRLADQSQTRILVLVSTTSGSRRQLSQQERSIAMLEALEIPFETLNCTMPEHRARRDAYFEQSGVRGEFPQFFLLRGDNNKKDSNSIFLGQFDDMEACNENSNMPNESLKEDDLTWDKIMGTTNEYNHKGITLDGANDDDDSDGSGGAEGGIYGALDSDDDDDVEDWFIATMGEESDGL